MMEIFKTIQKKWVAITYTLLLIAFLAMIKSGAEDFWSRFRDFTDPNYTNYMMKKWEKKSSHFLISRLGHPSYTYSDVARVTLMRRPEPATIGKIKKLITSKNIRVASAGLDILFAWDESQGIDLSMQILKEGRENPLNLDALAHLAHIQYEPAYPYAVELAKATDRYNNGSLSILSKFKKPESLPILEKMLQEAPSKFDKQLTSEAIEEVRAG